MSTDPCEGAEEIQILYEDLPPLIQATLNDLFSGEEDSE